MASSGSSDHIWSVGNRGGRGSIYDIPKPYLDMLAAQGSHGASPFDLQTPPKALTARTETPYASEVLSSTPASLDDQEHKNNKRLNAKKGNLTKQGEPRFAFLTKTKVELDDGYKWRKYGQRALKNNPFTRSYYRCTSEPACRVKKMTERSVEDTSILVTTYEGTHTHPCPMIHPEILPEKATYRAGHHVSSCLLPQLHHQPPPSQPPFYNQPGSSCFNLINNNTTTASPLPYFVPRDHGLLQDMLPLQVRNEEPSEGILGNPPRISF